MKKSKNKKDDYRSKLEGNESKLEMTLWKIVSIMVLIWGLYKLATTGGRGYDHFIGEPLPNFREILDYKPNTQTIRTTKTYKDTVTGRTFEVITTETITK